MAKNNAKNKYDNNKLAKVGEEIICPICGKRLIKKSYQQAFCCTRCKDIYHNKRRVNNGYYKENCKSNHNNWYYKNRENTAVEMGYPDFQTMQRDRFNNDLGSDEDVSMAQIEVGVCERCGLRHEYCRCE